jgi:predicted nucleotidyltransferase
MTHELPPEVRSRIVSTLTADAGVMRAVLFGSRARGEARPGSDIDLYLEGDALDFDELLRLQRRIEALDLPWRVDLVLASQADAALRERVSREGVVWFEREGNH